jgi:hypothetical protein
MNYDDMLKYAAEKKGAETARLIDEAFHKIVPPAWLWLMRKCPFPYISKQLFRYTIVEHLGVGYQIWQGLPGSGSLRATIMHGRVIVL